LFKLYYIKRFINKELGGWGLNNVGQRYWKGFSKGILYKWIKQFDLVYYFTSQVQVYNSKLKQ